MRVRNYVTSAVVQLGSGPALLIGASLTLLLVTARLWGMILAARLDSGLPQARQFGHHGGMAYTTGTSGNLQSQLIDLSGIPLDELAGVSGLADALAVLQARIVHSAAPLCEGTMAACVVARGEGPRTETIPGS